MKVDKIKQKFSNIALPMATDMKAFVKEHGNLVKIGRAHV